MLAGLAERIKKSSTHESVMLGRDAELLVNVTQHLNTISADFVNDMAKMALEKTHHFPSKPVNALPKNEAREILGHFTEKYRGESPGSKGPHLN